MIRAMAVRALVLVALLAAPPRAHAAVDLNGPWGILATDTTFGLQFYCIINVGQAGTTLTVGGTCPLVGTLSLAGTVDPDTGVFAVNGISSSLCTMGLSVAGTANPTSTHFSATFNCGGSLPGTIEGDRCGNGVTDPGEACDDGNRNVSGDCCSPTCGFEPAGALCPDDGAVCTQDVCDGAGTCLHPALAAGTPCPDEPNACTDDACDGAGTCAHVPNAEPCSDGNGCTVGDTCAGGACTPGGCSPCCDPGAGCTASLASGCRTPVVPSGPLRYRGGALTADPSAQLLWRWRRGEAVTLADFGDPTASTDYTMCVYRFDDSAQQLGLVLTAAAPAGGTCGTKPCWKAAGTTGFKYADREQTPDGLAKLTLKSGAAGKASILVRGKGANLRLLPTIGPRPVIAQLRASNGQCWEAGYVDVVRDQIFFGGTGASVDFFAKKSSPSGAFLE